MGKYYSDKEREEWRKKAGYQSTSDIIAAEREAREQGAGGPSAREISMEEAERMMAEAVGGGGGENRSDKIVRLLESIDRKLDGIGRIG